MRKNTRASTMVASALFATILTIAAGSYLTVISSSSMGTARIGEAQKAFYAAEAGAFHMLEQANSAAATSVSGSLATSLYTASYAATYSGTEAKITSTGTVGSISRTLSVRVVVIPPYVRGAVTVNSSATTSGNIVIDGRDHDANGNLTGGEGINGISAAGLITQSGSSTIGGNGITPSSPASPASMEQSVNPFPSTAPWDILGISQSWFQTNVGPAQSVPPPAGFNGIYYYDPPGGTWNPVDLGNSAGILIVHNATNSAVMKNLNGTFKGLIITDQITHINGSAAIYGAVITTNQVGNVLGNGDALVAYSSSILSALGSFVGFQTSTWTKMIQAGSWKEE